MHQRIRVSLVLVLAIAAGAMLLVGCGDDGPGEKAAPVTSSTSSTTTSTTMETPLTVEVTEDVSFTGERTMDVYAPTEGSDWPMVVHFHGGRSSPAQSEELARSIAEQGVVVMVPEWRSLGPAGGSEDTICAVAFATRHGEEYGADTGRVTLSGYSTGGYTAIIHAFIGDEPPLPITDCAVDPAIDPPDSVVGGGAPMFAADWARQGLLAANPQWRGLTPEQIDAFDPYLAIGRNPDLVVRLVFGEDDVGGNPNIDQPIAESNRQFLAALLDADYDAEATELPGGHSAPVEPGSEELAAYVAVVVDTARHA